MKLNLSLLKKYCFADSVKNESIFYSVNGCRERIRYRIPKKRKKDNCYVRFYYIYDKYKNPYIKKYLQLLSESTEYIKYYRNYKYNYYSIEVAIPYKGPKISVKSKHFFLMNFIRVLGKYSYCAHHNSNKKNSFEEALDKFYLDYDNPFTVVYLTTVAYVNTSLNYTLEGGFFSRVPLMEPRDIKWFYYVFDHSRSVVQIHQILGKERCTYITKIPIKNLKVETDIEPKKEDPVFIRSLGVVSYIVYLTNKPRIQFELSKGYKSYNIIKMLFK